MFGVVPFWGGSFRFWSIKNPAESAGQKLKEWFFVVGLSEVLNYNGVILYKIGTKGDTTD